MILVRTNDPEQMFNTPCDLHLTTTNSTVKWIEKDGSKHLELIMGGGHALQVKNANPKLPKMFADYLIKNKYEYKLNRVIRAYYPYGLIANPKIKFGAFQTKDWVHQDSKLSLIKHSVSKLQEYLKKYPNMSVIMPFPGIGLGNLNESQVYFLIEELPDNVKVFKLE